MSGDRRGYFLPAAPYLPGHPKAHDVTTLAFLDAAGRRLRGGFDEVPVPWHIDHPPSGK